MTLSRKNPRDRAASYVPNKDLSSSDSETSTTESDNDDRLDSETSNSASKQLTSISKPIVRKSNNNIQKDINKRYENVAVEG